jgi:hypothetical protein
MPQQRDINIVAENIKALKSHNAPDTDIDQYIKEEGWNPDTFQQDYQNSQQQPEPISIKDKISDYFKNKVLPTATQIGKQTLETLPETAGMIGGGMLGAVSPIPGGAIIGAGLGAAGGHEIKNLLFGNQSRTPKEIALEDLSAGTWGAGAEIGGQLIGKALPPVIQATKSIIKRGVSSAFGPSLDAIDARLANPKMIRNAKTTTEIAEDMPKTWTELSQKITDADKIAWEKLSNSSSVNEGAFAKEELLNLVNDTRGKLIKINIPQTETSYNTLSMPNQNKVLDTFGNDIGNVEYDRGTVSGLTGTQNKLAYKRLTDLADDINKYPSTISQKDAKNLIQTIDLETNWNDPNMSALNESYIEIRKNLDNILKDRNIDYKNAMKPVDNLIRIKEDFEKAFNIENIIGKGPRVTDTGVQKVGTALKESKLGTQRTLENIKSETGKDYLTDIQNAAHAKEFENPDKPKYWNRTFLGGAGAAVGHTTGVPGASLAGGTAGWLMGDVLDKEGGALAGKLIDNYKAHPEFFGKFSQVLGQALQKSPQAFAVTHFLLGSNDPEYQMMMKDMEQ